LASALLTAPLITPKHGHAAVNFSQQSNDMCATLTFKWHAIDPGLPDFPACNL
jgi:hypothetical protein